LVRTFLFSPLHPLTPFLTEMVRPSPPFPALLSFFPVTPSVRAQPVCGPMPTLCLMLLLARSFPQSRNAPSTIVSWLAPVLIHLFMSLQQYRKHLCLPLKAPKTSTKSLNQGSVSLFHFFDLFTQIISPLDELEALLRVKDALAGMNSSPGDNNTQTPALTSSASFSRSTSGLQSANDAAFDKAIPTGVLRSDQTGIDAAFDSDMTWTQWPANLPSPEVLRHLCVFRWPSIPAASHF
jgi:hypothetical protein